MSFYCYIYPMYEKEKEQEMSHEIILLKKFNFNII